MPKEVELGEAPDADKHVFTRVLQNMPSRDIALIMGEMGSAERARVWAGHLRREVNLDETTRAALEVMESGGSKLPDMEPRMEALGAVLNPQPEDNVRRFLERMAREAKLEVLKDV